MRQGKRQEYRTRNIREEHETANTRQEIGDRKQETGQKTGNIRREILERNKRQETGDRKQEPGNIDETGTGGKEQETEFRSEVVTTNIQYSTHIRCTLYNVL